MKILFALLLLITSDDGINKIAKINEYKDKANQAYMASEYKQAAKYYSILYDSMKVKEDPVIMNLAHSYYHIKDTTNAQKYYGLLTQSKRADFKSTAFQQLGNIQFDKKNLEQALGYFKNALRANPQNNDARYNYELVKKILDQQKQQEEQQKDQKVEPSEYAKKLKEQSDNLVRNNRFIEAYSLMQQGLQIDKTVSAYNEYIQKLKDVAEVETSKQ